MRRAPAFALLLAAFAASAAPAPFRIGVIAAPGENGDALVRGAEFGGSEARATASLLGKDIAVIVRRASTPSAAAKTAEELVREGVAAIAGGSRAALADAIAETVDGRVPFLQILAPGEKDTGLADGRYRISPDRERRQAAATRCVGTHSVRPNPGVRRIARSTRFRPHAEGSYAIAHGDIARRDAQRASAPSRRQDRPINAIPAARSAALRDAEASSIVQCLVRSWYPEFRRYGAQQLNARFLKETGEPMTAEAWEAWIAVKILAETFLRARTGDPLARLAETRIDGHQGTPIRFDERRVLQYPLHVGIEKEGKIEWVR